MYEQSGYGKQEHSYENVLEVSGWEVFMYDQSDFEKCCTPEGKKKWKIDTRTFLDDQDCSHHQKWKKDEELKPCQFEPMRLVKAVILFLRGLAC